MHEQQCASGVPLAPVEALWRSGQSAGADSTPKKLGSLRRSRPHYGDASLMQAHSAYLSEWGTRGCAGTPERAQIVLAVAASPLLSWPWWSGKLIPKLCSLILTAPSSCRQVPCCLEPRHHRIRQ